MIHLRFHSDDVRSLSAEPLEDSLASLAPPAPQEPQWAQALQQLAVQIPKEATRTEMLVGMGLGSIFFQVGNLLGLRGLLAAGLRGEAAVWLGRMGGWAAESTGFMAASHGAALALGQPVEHDWRVLGREWLSMACFLGMTRLGLGGVRQIYGANWAAKTPWQSFHFGLAQQTAALAATLGMGAAEWRLGLRNYSNGKDLAIDSLAQLGTFQLAGLLAYHGLGHRLSPLERSLETKARLLETRANASKVSATPVWQEAYAGIPGVSLDSMSIVFNKADSDGGNRNGNGNRDHAGFFGVEPSKAEATAPKPRESAHVIPVIGLGEIVRRLSGREVLDLLVKQDVLFQVSGSLSSGTPESFLARVVQELNDNTNRGKGTGGKSALISSRTVFVQLDPKIYPHYAEPFEITLGKNGFQTKGEDPNGDAFPDTLRMDLRRLNPKPPAVEVSMLNISEVGNDDTLGAFLELKRKVEDKDESDKLTKALMEEDRTFHFRQALGYRPEWSEKLLNELPKLAEIPDDREVTFTWPGIGGKQTVVFVKREGRFVDKAQEDSHAPSPTRRRRQATTPVAPAPEAEPASGVKEIISGIWERQHIPPIFEDLQHLPILIRQADPQGYPGNHRSLIFLGKSAHTLGLNQATQGPITGLVDANSWELFVPQNPKSSRVFRGVVKNGEILWQYGDSSDWEKAERQVYFSNRIITEPVEIFLHLEAMSRVKGTLPDSIIFNHYGTLTSPYVEALASYINQILNHHPMATSTLAIVEKQTEREVLAFSKLNERWRYFIE